MQEKNLNETQETTTTTTNETVDANVYLQKLNELKQNTVAKADYEKLVKENETLANAIANNNYIMQEQVQPKEPVDLSKLRHQYFETDGNNYEKAKQALALRNAVLEQEGYDPFVPKKLDSGSHLDEITDAQWQQAMSNGQKVADALQYCIDECDGDGSRFDGIFQSILAEDDVTVKAILQKKGKK